VREEIRKIQSLMESAEYVTDAPVATSVHLAQSLRKPLLIEGHAGVGKTEVAKVLAEVLSARLIRLQCYEGLDVHHAVYEWNYVRQMMHIRLAEARGEKPAEAELFGAEFLLKRPLLEAIDGAGKSRAVLLIDEIDRSDEEFEAYLLEVLSDFQITIPEIGTVRAEQPPVVVITSNRTREVHDAVKRRCLYQWIDYPSFEEELSIVRAKVPEAPERLARDVARFVAELRRAELYKLPGVAETLDWAAALVALDKKGLDLETVRDTLGILLKYRDDVEAVKGETAQAILARVQAGA